MNFIGRLKKFDSHIIANKYFWTLIGCTHANQLKYFSMYLTRGKTVAHPSPTWTLGPLMQCTYPPSIPRLPRFENHHLQSTDKMAAFPSCSSPSHHIFPPPPPPHHQKGGQVPSLFAQNHYLPASSASQVLFLHNSICSNPFLLFLSKFS